MKVNFNKVKNDREHWIVELLPSIAFEGDHYFWFEISITWLIWGLSFFWEFSRTYDSVDEFMDSLEGGRRMSTYNNQSLNLEILAEEAAEIIQIKSKIIRFGIDDYHPKNKLPNRQKLEEEIGHFLYVMNILIDNGTISQEGIDAGWEHKKNKMPKWYRY